jgi:hypothetical protein
VIANDRAAAAQRREAAADRQIRTVRRLLTATYSLLDGIGAAGCGVLTAVADGPCAVGQ